MDRGPRNPPDAARQLADDRESTGPPGRIAMNSVRGYILGVARTLGLAIAALIALASPAPAQFGFGAGFGCGGEFRCS